MSLVLSGTWGNLGRESVRLLNPSHSPRGEEVQTGLQSQPVTPKAGEFARFDPVVACRGGWTCMLPLCPGPWRASITPGISRGEWITGLRFPHPVVFPPQEMAFLFKRSSALQWVSEAQTSLHIVVTSPRLPSPNSVGWLMNSWPSLWPCERISTVRVKAGLAMSLTRWSFW